MQLLYDPDKYLAQKRRFAEFVFKMADKVKSSGEIRKTKFLYNLLVKKRFLEFRNSDPTKIATQLDKVITLLNNMHGDNWDFLINPAWDNLDREYLAIGVIIHYPNLIITNGKGDEDEFEFNGVDYNDDDDEIDDENRTYGEAMEAHCASTSDRHAIKDLLVVLQIESGATSPNEICFMKMEGTRASQSLAEYSSKYMHSHLNTRMPGNFGEKALELTFFCLGESDINNHLNIGLEARYVFEETDFEMLLHLIDEYVIWESLAGGPYTLIQNINANQSTARTTSELSSTLTTSYLKTLFSERQILRLFSEEHYTKLNFILVEDKYKIKQDNALEKVVLDALLFKGINCQYLIYTPENNKYIAYPSDRASSGINVNGIVIHDYKINGEIPRIQFRDTVLEYHIKMPNEGQEQVFNYNVLRVHPNFIQYVKEIVDKEIYKASIKEAARKVTNQ